MGLNSRINYILLANLVIICVISCGVLTLSAQAEQTLTTATTIGDAFEITDFSDFYLQHDDVHIASENLIDEINFGYYGTVSDDSHYDRYEYDLPKNCTDFYIRAKLQFTAGDVGSTFISYLWIDGEDHAIGAVEIYDAWTGSQAKYYLKAYPNGEVDDYETAANTAGLSGTVIFEIYRFGEDLEMRILNEDCTVIHLSHRWDDGANDTKISGFNVNHRAGVIGSNSQATFSDVYACFALGGTNFTFPEPIIVTVTETVYTWAIGYSIGLPIAISAIFMGILIVRRKRKN